MANNQQTHGIRTVDKIGYALGDLGGILTFSLVSSFLTMFYTDILGISTASITVLMLIARIWDATRCGAHLLTRASPRDTGGSGRIFSARPFRLP